MFRAGLLSTGIQDLALELIQEIIFYSSIVNWSETLSKTELAALCLVCRQFKSAAEPFLFSEVKYDFLRHAPASVMDYLQTLAERTNPAVQYAKTLRIRKLIPNLRGEPCEGVLAREKLGHLIMQATRSLQNVRSVYWNLYTFDAMYSVIDGLVELPHIEELHLEFSNLPVQWQVSDTMPIRRFGNLRCINISGSHLSSILAMDLIIQIRTMVKDGGVLTHFGFTLPSGIVGIPNKCLLHEIVQEVPRTSPLKLCHLRVEGYSLKIDSVTLPHLRVLSSLDVSRMPNEETGIQRQLWTGLRAASIQLRDIVIGGINEQLLQYLKSYPGLEQFAAHGEWRGMQKGSDQADPPNLEALSRELYSAVIPVHMDSLVSFKALTRWLTESPSCISYDNIASILVCKKLATLAFTVKVADINNNQDMIRDVLKMALDLPHIKTIEVSYAWGGRCRWGCCSSGRLKQRMEDIIYSIDVHNDIRRNLTCCEIMFEGNRYIPGITEDGLLRFLNFKKLHPLFIQSSTNLRL
ncbi:hypothetical protein BDZ97DRAFT_1761114 [Flammula alnicola]|nr:hypothetical protein BDZ97DRAFT_1761114 [Flammula alnicola]